jgi:alkanesulfonate monooxygenase SsuD/methylene tetrahydromethanopterin reductase-like flavin-dependent oxidoreductase (luciferase family)
MKIGWILVTTERGVSGYSEVRDMALRVEAESLDSIWLFDHLLYRPPGERSSGIWESWTFLSALAEATRRVELGTLVSCTQFRHPALLAKMAVTLDEVSGGRLILGLGAGWNEPEFRAFGMPYDHRVSRFEEALHIIKPLLREEQVDFLGTYYQARECEIKPHGPRPGGPPILIAGQGPRMLRLTAQFADSWNTSYPHAPESLIEPRTHLFNACAEVGRNPATLEVTVEVALNFPDLGSAPSSNIKHFLRGSTEEIARTMFQYEQLGVGQLMFQCFPSTPAAVSRLAEAVKVYRSWSPGDQKTS